jgi:molybdenum cofactor cytidylyltransferase
MTRVSAILLAAGESRRMGTQNKLALPVGGVPLLRRTAQTLLASGLREVVAVLGHEVHAMQGLLKGLPLRLVENPRYREGQMSSVHCGLDALAGPCDGVMICLADQPLLTPADIDTLIAAFARCARGGILVPTWAGRRGNPVVLDYAQHAAILAGGRNLGCRHLIERLPERVTTFAMASDHVVFDLDTPADYAALQARLPGPGARLTACGLMTG